MRFQLAVHDVVILGGGNAGLCAALAARDGGARVLVLERSPEWRRGGNSRHTRDIRYANESGDRWAPTAYPASTFLADLAAVTEIRRPELTELLVEESRTLPTFMEDHGVLWQAQMRGTLHLETNRFFLGGGRAMMNSYYRTAARCGIDVLYDARAIDVVPTRRGCTVTFAWAGAERTVDTQAVVVAAGGIEANRDWLEQTWGPGGRNFIVRGTPDNDGGMLLALYDRAAAKAGTDLFHCTAVDARAPECDGGIVTRVDSIPFGVVLNKQGRRFYDEGEDAWPKRYAVWGQMIGRQPDQIAYSIFDSRSRGLFIPPAYPPLQSESLEGLLAELELDVAEALRTIAEFNAAVDDSLPFDFSRLDGRAAPGIDPPRSNWARRIDQPPFYAYPLRPGLTFTYRGVAVDENARVLREDGASLGNVFAAGEIMAGNILTSGYLAGAGLAIGGVFGRIAGREAARA
jgi:tricarballylate dehydrogenase